jgi:hypothetical protein
LSKEIKLTRINLRSTKVKELKATVSPAQGNMSLKEFRDGLGVYTEEELKTIKVRTLGEHPDDAYAKDLGDYIHVTNGQATPQYITVTKLLDVYDVSDTSINNSQLDSSVIEEGYPPGTQSSPIVQEQIALTTNAIADNTADATIMQTAAMMAANNDIVVGSAVTPVVPPITRDEAQQQTIKDLQSQVPPAPIGGTAMVSPTSVTTIPT